MGLQISHGNNPSLFEQAGLELGDIITHVNGLDATDLNQSELAIEELRQVDFVELTVNRAGDYLTLYIELPEKK